ncbi:GTPase Era [Mesomycoplasma conjunctivae]|uniref:GTPase Era n=1 Tax=Mesomycoplasma conjunctivae TaxID=45361 RepID=UPI003DA54472
MAKTCFVSIVGLPNSGKSSLLNTLLDFPISIVSSKSQTTRDLINGIYNEDNLQIVFVDTPGFHKKINNLSNVLNKAVINSIEDIDVVLFLHPVNWKISNQSQQLVEKIANVKNKIAVLTKLDLIDDQQIIETKVAELKQLGFKKVFGYSTEFKVAKQDLLEEIKSYAYESDLFFEQEDITDQPARFFAKEIIRKQLLLNLKEEIPHQSAIVIERFSEANPKHIEIDAIIYVGRKSHLPIVVGKNGAMLGKIGTAARLELEELLQSKVVLKNKVKISPKWFDNKKTIKKMGYE